MELLGKAVSLTLISVILIAILDRQGKEYGLLITLTACTMIGILCTSFWTSVYSFLKELEVIGNLPGDMLRILLKALSIGLTVETATLVCMDAGNAALGKLLKMFGSAAILSICIPMLKSLLNLLQQLLGEI